MNRLLLRPFLAGIARTNERFPVKLTQGIPQNGALAILGQSLESRRTHHPIIQRLIRPFSANET